MKERQFKKRFIISSIAVMLAIPQTTVFAQVSSEDTNTTSESETTLTVSDVSDEQSYFIYNPEKDEDAVSLYEEKEENEELLLTEIPNEAEIEVVIDQNEDNSPLEGAEKKEADATEEFVFIRYIDPETEVAEESSEIYEGYINIEYIYTYEELSEILENSSSEDSEDTDPNEETNEMTEKEESKEEESPTKEETNDNTDDKVEDPESNTVTDDPKVTEEENEELRDEGTPEEDTEEERVNPVSDEKTVTEEDAVEEEASGTEDNVKEKEESIEENNSVNMARSFSTFSAPAANQYNGIALNNRTHVFKATSTNSNILKSYNKGSILKYRDHNSSWYAATVWLDGEPVDGFIHKNHVENSVANQQALRGIATQSTTRVYQTASTSSGVWKSYSKGSILQYRTFSNNWYQATVYTNGIKRTGYIHKNHVENAVENQQDLRGIGQQSPTHVFKSASTGSAVWKSYSKGSILQYRTFSNNWYEATVYTNGKKRTGYIHKNHVENAVENQQNLRGIGQQDPTHVYRSASTGSGAWKSYAEGSVLQYRTFSSNWYQATVYTNGKKRTGYIHKNHVENAVTNQEDKNGFAAKSPTNVYANASRDADVLKTYRLSHGLKFKTFSSNWYEATVYLNGTAHTGYIHKSDVAFEPILKVTNYNYSFSNIVDKQMNVEPKANGPGTIPANRSLVEYFANPANFPEGEDSFYQFLELSTLAGLDKNEVNRNILNNVGTLSGTASAFIEAAEKNTVNEAYLIAHALHETGNGGSALAQGVQVNGRTVYNMFGISAYDGTAVISGSEYAYRAKWFTPEEAIKGGAEWIAKNYIHHSTHKQNTLYKMRWNPSNPATHQYATHVAWAEIPTTKIAEVYNSLDTYGLRIFDVPHYKNQPGYQGPEPPPNTVPYQEFPNNIKGLTTGTNVNFRTQPSTGPDSSVITSISNRNSSLTLLGTNGIGWYKANYNGDTGWISADYVDVTNLLEITASRLNVRTATNTNNDPVGQLNNGDLVRAVTDSNDEFVTSNGWYQIYYNGDKRWISSGPNHNYIKLR